MRSLLIVTLAFLLSTSAVAGKKKTPVSAVIAHARYVCILPLSADPSVNSLSASVTPEDRRDLYAVDSEMRRWKRYIVVINPEDADIILAVRAGRSASVNTGVSFPDSVNLGSNRRPTTTASGSGVSTGVEAGPTDDTLAIFVGHSTDSSPLWIHRQSDGLQGDLPLVKAFEKDVAKTDKILGDKP